MPHQGVSSTFSFGRAVGVISAVCELTNYPFHLVSPQKWKKHFGLNADKNEALDKARELFPKAKSTLKLKKDIHKAEALLIARYWRDQVHG
jgi:crossover junction endodeoxyribonuclease RuvC